MLESRASQVLTNLHELFRVRGFPIMAGSRQVALDLIYLDLHTAYADVRIHQRAAPSATSLALPTILRQPEGDSFSTRKSISNRLKAAEHFLPMEGIFRNSHNKSRRLAG